MYRDVKAECAYGFFGNMYSCLPVLLALVTSLIMTQLDYGSAVLAGIPSHLLKCLQSVLNAAARLVCRTCKYDHVIHLLRDLHWLRIPERIQF